MPIPDLLVVVLARAAVDSSCVLRVFESGFASILWTKTRDSGDKLPTHYKNAAPTYAPLEVPRTRTKARENILVSPI